MKGKNISFVCGSNFFPVRFILLCIFNKNLMGYKNKI